MRSYINMKREWVRGLAVAAGSAGCLRQPSRSFGTLPSPLSCQINIFAKNVDTSHAKSMFRYDLQGITRICLHLGWTCQDWKDLEGFWVQISLKV